MQRSTINTRQRTFTALFLGRNAMKTIKLLSWHDDVETKATSLKRPDRRIDTVPLISASGLVRELAHINPAVLIFDLDKLPSKSREIALVLRSSKSARHIPLLFAGGLPE